MFTCGLKSISTIYNNTNRKALGRKRKELRMKKIVFPLALIALFLAGCQDNSNTDPVSSNQIDKNNGTIENSFKGSIPVDKLLFVPGFGEMYYRIKGKIDYNGEFTSFNPYQTNSLTDEKVEIAINALLLDNDISIKNPSHNHWRILADSQDRFYINPEGKKVIEKVYPVLHRSDELQLICAFVASKNDLILDSMILQFPLKEKI